MKKLKLFNGRDLDGEGLLYVAAYSQKDAIDLLNQAYRNGRKLEDRLDVHPYTLREIQIYWNKGHWGNTMDGITPERGVWRDGKWGKTPKRLL